MSSRPKRATLKTVAEACGFAVTTVSRALNGHDDIALATRAKVRQVAKDVGYVPNRQGQALRTGQNRLISLVVPSHAAISGYTSSIIFSMGEVFRDAGYELCAMPAYRDKDDIELVRSIVEDHNADGLILTRTKPQDLRVRYLVEKEVPFVTHGRTELASPHAFVDFDNQCFSELATQRLIKQGRKRLMLIGPEPSLTYANHIAIGFEQAAARAGVDTVEPIDELYLNTPLDTLRKTVCRALQSPTRPDGIVCAGELPALATLGAIIDAGLEPNKEVGVICKQTSSVLDHTHPLIDTLFEDLDATGRILAESMLRLLTTQVPPDTVNTLIEPQVRWRLSA